MYNPFHDEMIGFYPFFAPHHAFVYTFVSQPSRFPIRSNFGNQVA